MSDSDKPKFIPVGGLYATAEDLRVELSEVPQVSHSVLIPAGYTFDGASIPRWLWSLIGSPFEPELMLAACVHDWYCEHTSQHYESRAIGDSVFFMLLRKAGVPVWRRRIMFLGVRANSFWFYGRSIQ
jgi:hypothetical protein